MKTVSLSNPIQLTDRQVRALYIANPDGSPRWIWPASATEPTFLSFYPAGSLRQRAFRLLVRIVFLLRLQRLVFSAMEVDPPADTEGNTWALFTGTVGPNRKEVLIQDRHTVVKTAVGIASRRNIDNEGWALRFLSHRGDRLPFAFPRLLKYRNDQLSMQRLADRGTWNRMTSVHTEALRALRTEFAESGPLRQWTEWRDVQKCLRDLNAQQDERLPSALLSKLGELAATLDPETTVRYGFSHGDFTPWNTLRTDGDQLGIIDWELARDGMPVGYDFFHFHLQQGIMVARKSWAAIYQDIRAELSPLVKLAVFGSARVDVDYYLRLYLLHHITYYSTVYARQEKWHPQIHWQLDVWADALQCLAPAGLTRPELIGNLFGELEKVDYAVLKLGDQDPRNLPQESDLDILMSRSSANGIIEWLAGAPGVERVRTIRKSFMASLAVVLNDGQLLHLDLIWNLKRKATVFMDAAGMIARGCTNPYGFVTVNQEDTDDYLRLFYGLNGQAIPEKYEVAAGPAPALPRRENRGLRKWRNRFDYLRDTLFTAWSNRGYLVTFSGVDGAGKSTVIGEVTGLIDKRIRRPVKVLRHRPSLLPILSAYVHGKEGAEQRSVERLPRTGNNRSVLSSIFRFGYYFADYLVGQWYIYFRYVLRGYAVVYDRYYYDFILDARRSNIELPAFVPRWGLPFLMKPRYNFFLYADADTILARKQELDRETIVDLTTRYRTLFAECQQSYPDRVFASLENIHLDETLTTIEESLKTAIR
ncbi:phosphotransferase [Lewinella sp. IMCC34191]|uniref:phosphotransferase n=1 Tax=Lewinella sp. IMCC34191 TaxID=2259172 RepID=UPI001300884F|nr:phosphotransferase [Lewinella sp. IMCC34191]